jgi:CubicO group peptidase (beta-lactamase class C family)
LRSTAQDYFRFAQCLLDGGELDGTRILRRSSVELMMTDHVGDLYPYGDGDYGWGFGGRVRRSASTGGPEPVGTYGWNGGTGTFFWIDPRTKLVGIVFAPFNPPPPWELYGRFQQAAYRSLARPAGEESTRKE